MKIPLLFLAGLAGFASLPAASLTAAEPQPLGEAGRGPSYRLVWSDEFDGGALDPKKWIFRTDRKHWSAQQAANVSVCDGRLIIALRKESVDGMAYTGGGVISREAFRYGYYEARMKVPPGAGWHTSFWMMAHAGLGGTEPRGAHQEIDVIENDSVHPRSYGVNIHKWRDGHVAFGGRKVTVPEGEPSLNEDFHVFGAEFTPEKVTFYLDGRVVQTVDVTSARGKDGKPLPFPHGDQNVWLTAIASHLGGTKAVDDARLPATAEFDYVRVFAPAPGAGGR